MFLDVRLFTGLSLPPEMLARLGELLDELEPLARINWSPLSELHITTKFIGKWPFNRVPELARFLNDMPRLDKFTVTVTGLGYFPRPHKAWVLYARVEPCEGLTKLAAALDEGLEHFDVRREWEAYRPHITIGRVQGNNPWPDLDQRVEAHAATPFGSFEATEYHLYESTPSGYRKCASIPLT